MFHHRNISAHAPSSVADILTDRRFNKGTFRLGEFSGRGIVGTMNNSVILSDMGDGFGKKMAKSSLLIILVILEK